MLVPINFRLNRDEIAYIVEHSGASALLVDPEYDELTRDIPTAHRFVLGTDTDRDLFERSGNPKFLATTRPPPRRSTTRRARPRGPRACR